MSNPYKVVKDFEAALCDYTGAKYAVTTTSCTMALLLALRWHLSGPQRTPPPMSESDGEDDIGPYRVWKINIPKRTYIGVPMSIINAGARVTFRDAVWVGDYRLQPTKIWDSARHLTSDMFPEGQMQCLSFHWTKHLAIGQGGAILHDNDEADAFLRRSRFDGRTESVPSSEDNPPTLGYHAYMSPRDAAEGLSRLAVLPADNDPLPWDDYPDLSKMEIFK